MRNDAHLHPPLRQVIGKFFPAYSEFSAFLLDYFPGVRWDYGDSAARTTIENDLFIKHSVQDIIGVLLRIADLPQKHPEAYRTLRCLAEAMPAGPPQLSRPTAGDVDLSLESPAHRRMTFARNLDRQRQWNNIREWCHRDHDIVILIHGSKDAELEYLLERTLTSLNRPGNANYHLPVTVPFTANTGNPWTGFDWVSNFSNSLTTAVGASLAEIGGQTAGRIAMRNIAQVTQSANVLVILGDRMPMSISESSVRGLAEFVYDYWPTIISRRGTHPTRLIVPVHFRRPDDSSLRVLQKTLALLRELATHGPAGTAQPRRLETLEIHSPPVPEWPEVQQFLFELPRVDRCTGRLKIGITPREMTECKSLYENLKAENELSFQKLVRDLVEYLFYA